MLKPVDLMKNRRFARHIGDTAWSGFMEKLADKVLPFPRPVYRTSCLFQPAQQQLFSRIEDNHVGCVSTQLPSCFPDVSQERVKVIQDGASIIKKPQRRLLTILSL